MSIMSRIFL